MIAAASFSRQLGQQRMARAIDVRGVIFILLSPPQQEVVQQEVVLPTP
jgi:hypothetical protein